MKILRILGRNINHAFKSVFRNLSLSLASIVCTTITLILVSIAVILTVNVNNFTKHLEDELTILVVMNRGTTEEQDMLVKDEISKIENVVSENIVYKNKEQVKIEAMQKSSDLKSIMETWTEETNPLQSDFIVPVKDIRNMKETVEEIKNIENIYTVNYGEDTVTKIVPIFDVVNKASIVIIGALIVVTVFLICNTIKLTIFSRKNEIDIMRLVGISNTVIRLPFVFEGLFLGIAGSIIPIAATIYGYILAYDNLNGYFVSSIIKLVEPLPFILYNSLLLLLIGVIVGMIGSYRSVRKYLKI